VVKLVYRYIAHLLYIVFKNSIFWFFLKFINKNVIFKNFVLNIYYMDGLVVLLIKSAIPLKTLKAVCSEAVFAELLVR